MTGATADLRARMQAPGVRTRKARNMDLKLFDQPDESYALTKGRFDVVRIGGLSIGRATYEPGWKWSEHVGKAVGQARCTVEHVGLVLSGAATVAFEDGRVIELHAGSAFHIPSVPHDS